MSVEAIASADALDVFVGGADRIWGWRSRLEIPMGRVLDVRVVPTIEAKSDQWLRTLGLGIPKLAAVGHFRGRLAKKQWWRVYRAPRVVMIELAPASQFDRIVLQVRDPDATAADILRHRRARADESR